MMMIKNILNMLVGALICAAVGSAFAVVGTPPFTGPGLVDGVWLNGLAGGLNFTTQSGITAHAGGTQAACLSLTPGAYLYEVDTVASGSDSICLPFAVPGFNISIRNAGAQTLAIYGQSANNALTAAADTINATAGSSAYTMIANNSAECFVAKAGSWSCVQGH
jgi:hypothetical protein